MSVIAERRKPAGPSATARSRSKSGVPELENGDNLETDEFLQRYAEMPPNTKAELVDGMVYLASPVSFYHGEPDGIIQTWLGHYAAFADGVKLLPNTTLLLDPKNTVQPDAMLIAGEIGKSQAGYVTSTPGFVVEIAHSSASIDLNRKLDVYRRHGVPEYLVWRAREEVLDWFVLDESRAYVSRDPDSDGLLRSKVFPGLVLDAQALLRLDSRAVLEALAKERS